MRRRRAEEIRNIANNVPVVLTGITHGGEAIGRYGAEVTFVAGGIPGEEVRVDIFRARKGVLRGNIREVTRPAPERVNAPCPYFAYCGGCQWQYIGYGTQLALKKRIVLEQLQRLGSFPEPPVEDTLASPRQWYYRNHVRFSTGRHGHLGFKRPASHRFLAIDHCMISHAAINDLLIAVQGQGVGLHQVVMRVGEHTGDLLLYPSLAVPNRDKIKRDELTEELLGRKFHVGLSSFFQVNTLQAEQLASLVIQRLSLTGRETVVDAYGGVGTFAVLLAEHAKSVIGIEEARSAIRNAERNALALPNVRFVAGKTENILPDLTEQVDAVVLDPARVGCDPAVIEALAKLRPLRIVYVSCDPATLARDLKSVCQRGYRLEAVQPVDMFPQTYHIESVASVRYEGVDA